MESKEITEKYNLTDEEKLKAKENGFILIGKTGTGKTSLLNLIYGMDIGKVGFSSKSETSKSSAYFIKEQVNSEYIYFCIIDTPGLYDTHGYDIDEKNKNSTKDLISNENIKIKGIFFLSNFQNERFDFSEINTLINYNSFFPLKNFWKHIILIFTHYYGDPYGDTVEEMKQNLFLNLSDSFQEIMNKVKNVSKPIKFKDINKLFINVYSKKKNEKQIKNNELIRKDILKEIIKYIQFEPMYNKINIIHFEKYELEENDEFLYDCDYIIFLDFNDRIIHQSLEIIKLYNKKNEDKNNIIELSVINCEKDIEGNLYNKNIEKKGINEILQENAFKYLGNTFTVSSILFTFILSSFHCGLGIIPGGIFYFMHYLNSKKKNDEKQKQNKKRVEELDILDFIRNEIKKQISKQKSNLKL